MIKAILKQEKGVTLISLAATIIVLGIVTSILLYSARDTKHITSLTDMYTDIENLSDKISTYYAQYGKVPGISLDNDNKDNDKVKEIIGDVLGANDTGVFLVIDLNQLENLTLNYGKEYENYKSNSTLQSDNGKINDDIYIINENSHNIFYLAGIKVDDDTYYTNQDKDSVEVNLRYVDGIKIPDGYYYAGKDGNGNITISKNATTYTWKAVDNKITEKNDTINIDNDETEDAENNFVKSVNLYGGYYYYVNELDNSTHAVYIEVSESALWTATYEDDGTYTDENGDTAYVPKGFRVSKSKFENKIKNGLVIQETATKNEYVWIDVPEEITEDCATYTQIENALQDYAKDYRDDNYSDVWYAESGFSNSNDYETFKNKVLNSIKQNGGFYIARYEAVKGSETSDSYTAKSIANATPKTVSTVGEARKYKKLSEEDSSITYETDLMFGFQWDLVCKFLEESGNLTKDEILNDVENLGNYTTTSTLTTGQKEIANIYDLAGNVAEFTYEAYNKSSATYRGGSAYGEDGSLASRNTGGEPSDGTTSGTNYIGFRQMLFIP